MTIRVLTGDCRDILPTLEANSVHTIVTSPPYYGLRDYGVDGQIGLEATPDEYIATMVAVFRELRRVLRDDGTVWCNMGDGYASGGTGGAPSSKSTLSRHGEDRRSPYLDALGDSIPRNVVGAKPKDLLMMPSRLALALQADGWWIRSDIIWAKPNAMPESVTDRPTSAHEHVFLITKSARYYYDADAVREPLNPETHARGKDGSMDVDRARWGNVHVPGFDRSGLMTDNPAGRNLRNVWTIATQAFSGSHPATMPTEVVARCIKAGCPKDGTVLDPFAGASTTLLVAQRLQRDAIGIELNSEYVAMSRKRIEDDAGLFADFGAASVQTLGDAPTDAAPETEALDYPDDRSVCRDLGDAQSSLWEWDRELLPS